MAPVPFCLRYTSRPALSAGSDAQKASIPEAASGEIDQPFARCRGRQPPARRRSSIIQKCGKLDGTKVPYSRGDIADFAVVLTRTGEGQGERALSLAIVDLKSAGVTRRAVKTVDPSRSQAELTFKGATAEQLGASGDGWDLTKRVLDRAAVLMAFEQVGGAELCDGEGFTR